MHEIKPAAVHVKRYLTRAEIATIALALELLRQTPADEIPAAGRVEIIGDEAIESDDAIAMLIRELCTARKVKVCRSKQKPA